MIVYTFRSSGVSMSQTLSGSSRFRAGSAKSTCGNCSRTVHMVTVGDDLVAVDPEVIRIVRVGTHGGTMTGQLPINARRLHAELCETYQRDDRRAKTRLEIAEFEKRLEKKRRRRVGL